MGKAATTVKKVNNEQPIQKRSPKLKEIDVEGLKRLKKRLAEFEKEHAESLKRLSQIISTDGANLNESNSLMYEIAREDGIRTNIANLKAEIASYEVVEKTEDSNFISFGDKVTVEVKYPDGDFETETYMLVGYSPDVSKKEISPNSPVGKFIYGKEVGDFGEITLPDKSVALIKIISKE